MVVEFTVPGTPAPQGSHVRTRHGLREDNPATLPWRDAVGWHARQAMGSAEPLVGPVSLSVWFQFPRPQSHYRASGRALRDAAPAYEHSVRPDLDKLLRAVCDALTGIVYRQDSQVAAVTARKTWGPPSATIRVEGTA